MTLLAGGGAATGDHVSDARQSRLVDPRGVNISAQGHVYVAESRINSAHVSRIRKITSARKMDTVVRDWGLTSLAVHESDGVVYALKWEKLFAYLLPSWDGQRCEAPSRCTPSRGCSPKCGTYQPKAPTNSSRPAATRPTRQAAPNLPQVITPLSPKPPAMLRSLLP